MSINNEAGVHILWFAYTTFHLRAHTVLLHVLDKGKMKPVMGFEILLDWLKQPNQTIHTRAHAQYPQIKM